MTQKYSAEEEAEMLKGLETSPSAASTPSISTRESTNGWQPIETAPIREFDPERWFVDGESFLISAGFRVSIARYNYTQKGKGRWLERGYGTICNPTHWQPLPAPPSAEPVDPKSDP